MSCVTRSRWSRIVPWPPWPRDGGIVVAPMDLRATLRRRGAAIEKLRKRGDKLRRRERLGHENAVGNAARSPFVFPDARHVNDGKFGIELPGVPGDFPAIHPASQADIGHECPVTALVSP